MNQLNSFSNRFKLIASVLLCLSVLLLISRGEVLQTVQRALTGKAAVTTPAPKRNSAIPRAATPVKTGGAIELPQTVLAGGGGDSSSGAFQEQGTIGQSLTSVSSGDAGLHDRRQLPNRHRQPGLSSGRHDRRSVQPKVQRQRQHWHLIAACKCVRPIGDLASDCGTRWYLVPDRQAQDAILCHICQRSHTSANRYNL